MITKLDTSKSNPGSSSKGGGKIMLFLGLAIGGFLLYKFVIKPKMDESDKADN